MISLVPLLSSCRGNVQGRLGHGEPTRGGICRTTRIVASFSRHDDTDSTELDGEYDSEHDPDEDMRMEDDVDAPDRVESDSNLDVERDSD